MPNRFLSANLTLTLTLTLSNVNILPEDFNRIAEELHQGNAVLVSVNSQGALIMYLQLKPVKMEKHVYYMPGRTNIGWEWKEQCQLMKWLAIWNVFPS